MSQSQEGKYSVKFSGKGFPIHRRSKFTITAPNEDRANEWGERQLQAWDHIFDIDEDEVNIEVKSLSSEDDENIDEDEKEDV